MSFPKYESYKDSGVEWLGEVPSHWEVCAVKRIVRMQSGETITGESITETGEFPVFGGNGLRGYTSAFTHNGTFALIGRQGALCGNINYATGKFWASEHAVVASPLSPCETRWLGEMLRTMNLNQYSVSAAQPGLSVELVGNIRTVRPPLPEQRAIAAFLDRETAKIDDLIAEQKRLIALLTEKRQAVISHAVTKGLNPNAPMKDSGVEWLGEVPEHWTVKAIRHFAEVLRGKFTHRPRNDPQFYDGDYPFIQTGDITGSSRYITGFKQTLNERGIAVSKEFPKGTLVMAIAANIGDVAILDFPAYFPDSIVGLIPKISIDIMFLYYLMIGLKQPMLMTATVSTQMNLNVDQICSIVATCPPYNEQRAIVAFLNSETAKIDTLIAEAQRGISLLQERRSALISAAVTGKIDVRGAVA